MNEHDSGPLLLTLGLHAHQPEGNFGHVFQDHLRDVYEPFLRRAAEGDLLPLTLHLSGPLLDWLDGNASGYLDLIGELAGAGKLELLLAGYYEPILPSLPREDRIEQILWVGVISNHSFYRLWRLEREAAQSRERLDLAQSEMERLSADLQDPKVRRFRAEHALRVDQGMAGKNEIIYRFEENLPDSSKR